MITWQTLRKSIDNKQFGKGICTSDDEKPVENIANGSELIEIDTGKRCVFDLGREEWIEYGTGEDRSNKPKNVKTEVYNGTFASLFTSENFNALYKALHDDGAIGVLHLDTAQFNVELGLNAQQVSIYNQNVRLIGASLGLFSFTVVDVIDMSASYFEQVQSMQDNIEFEAWIKQHTTDYGVALVYADPALEIASYLSYLYYRTPNHDPVWMGVNDFENIHATITLYYMDEGIEPSGGAKVTTETISGPLSTIFSDNDYTEEKFVDLINDIDSGKAFASISLSLNDMGYKIFANPEIINGEGHALMMCISNNRRGDSNTTLSVGFMFDEGPEEVVGYMMLYGGDPVEWHVISESVLTQMTGQSSYDLVITRIEEE